MLKNRIKWFMHSNSNSSCKQVSMNKMKLMKKEMKISRTLKKEKTKTRIWATKASKAWSNRLKKKPMIRMALSKSTKKSKMKSRKSKTTTSTRSR